MAGLGSGYSLKNEIDSENEESDDEKKTDQVLADKSIKDDTRKRQAFLDRFEKCSNSSK
jgi:hypothetical protein